MTLGHPSPPAPTEEKPKGNQGRKLMRGAGREKRTTIRIRNSQVKWRYLTKDFLQPNNLKEKLSHAIPWHYAIHYTDGLIRNKDQNNWARWQNEQHARSLSYPQMRRHIFPHLYNQDQGNGNHMPLSYITECQGTMLMKRHHTISPSLASGPAIQQFHLPNSEQEENSDPNQLCKNHRLTLAEIPCGPVRMLNRNSSKAGFFGPSDPLQTQNKNRRAERLTKERM